MLTHADRLPDGFLDAPATELHRLLGGPTLIHLPGRREPPLFVSILLHGNEDSGLTAMQQVLRARAGRDLPRSLLLFVGNVGAAREQVRRLPGQPDYNRVWPGHAGPISPEAGMMAALHSRIVNGGAFAAIDLHNNTGRNPHYSVVCDLQPGTLHLASLFGPKVVWFRGLPGTETASLAGRLPAMTAECGQPGIPANAEAAARLVDAALDLDAFPATGTPSGLDLHHTLGVIRVPDEVSLEAEGGADLSLEAELESLNFTDLDSGALLGVSRVERPLTVTDESGVDITDRFIRVDEDGAVRLIRRTTPAMFASDPRAIRLDCLGYLMEPIPPELLAPAV